MSKLKLTPVERSMMRKDTLPLGSVIRSNGVLLKVVLRDEGLLPRDACRGCYYSQNYLTCHKSQCSSFGRTDGRNIWFVKVGDISK